MEKWLIGELEYKARMEQIEKERKTRLTVDSPSDLNVPNPDEMKALSFSSCYKGGLHPEQLQAWLDRFRLVEELSFYAWNPSVTWDTLAALDLSQIKSLTVSMQNSSQPVPLKAPKLEEFTFFGTENRELSAIEKLCAERTKYDFSGMPSLKKLKLHRCGFWDYASLADLPELEILDIADCNMTDLSWLSSNYALSALAISAHIDDLTGIERQPGLEKLYLGYNHLSDITALGKLSRLKHLDLRKNRIHDATPLEKLEFLEYLNLNGNPFVSEGDLRNKNIRTLILNPQDQTIEEIDQVISGFSHQVYWQRDAILRNHQKGYEERLAEKLQSVFEEKFQEMNPFNLLFSSPGAVLRETYISRAAEKYPCLRVTPDMQAVLQRESSRAVTRVPEIPGIAFFVNEDFVRICVKAKRGSGQIRQEYDKIYSSHNSVADSRKIDEAVKKNWDIFFPNRKMRDFDFEIIYAPLYGKEVDGKIAYAVLYAMWSAVHQIVVPKKTAILLKCSSSGRLNKVEASLRQIDAALRQGIESIISWKPKNKAPEYYTEEMTLYNTLEEFAAELGRQESAVL